MTSNHLYEDAVTEMTTNDLSDNAVTMNDTEMIFNGVIPKFQ